MTESFWFRQAIAAHEPLTAEKVAGRITADVCIVGGGFLGMWTAIHLKQADPKLNIVIVEKNICGSGASGRNGGFVTSYWAQYYSLLALAGADGAGNIARRSEQAIRELGDFCIEHGIDCDYRRDGWLWIASSQHQIGAWNGLVAELERHGQIPLGELLAVCSRPALCCHAPADGHCKCEQGDRKRQKHTRRDGAPSPSRGARSR